MKRKRTDGLAKKIQAEFISTYGVGEKEAQRLIRPTDSRRKKSWTARIRRQQGIHVPRRRP